ncbi:hypothetical protein HK096_007304 [Nowakowskiella sp. JEL0078]|nr:hypothetical protein HK096_007304 [Nowakowskiella sp. JEL0078]
MQEVLFWNQRKDSMTNMSFYLISIVCTRQLSKNSTFVLQPLKEQSKRKDRFAFTLNL